MVLGLLWSFESEVANGTQREVKETEKKQSWGEKWRRYFREEFHLISTSAPPVPWRERMLPLPLLGIRANQWQVQEQWDSRLGALLDKAANTVHNWSRTLTIYKAGSGGQKVSPVSLCLNFHSLCRNKFRISTSSQMYSVVLWGPHSCSLSYQVKHTQPLKNSLLSGPGFSENFSCSCQFLMCKGGYCSANPHERDRHGYLFAVIRLPERWCWTPRAWGSQLPALFLVTARDSSAKSFRCGNYHVVDTLCSHLPQRFLFLRGKI